MGGYGYGGMGGMGGYGGYGSYGGMYGGGMYGGMPGMMNNDPNNANSLTTRFSNNTQATFQMLEGIVGAFGGFAQMLESTYMATHSSFFGKSDCTSHYLAVETNLMESDGICRRAVWQPPRYVRIHPRHIYPHALDPHCDR